MIYIKMSTLIIWFGPESIESTVGTLSGNHSAFKSLENSLPFAILPRQGFSFQTSESDDVR